MGRGIVNKYSYIGVGERTLVEFDGEEGVKMGRLSFNVRNVRNVQELFKVFGCSDCS